jgi:protein gp37
MGTATKIEWCDHTASPWYGCAHAELPGGGMHPGCDNCYAEALSKRNPGTLGEWGPAGVRFVSKSFRKACKRFQKQAENEGRRVSVFPSLCDPFEDWKGNLHFTEKNDQGETESTAAWWRSDIGVCRAGETTVGNQLGERPATMADCRRDLFNSIDSNRLVDYLLLTKRPQNVRAMWPRLEYVHRSNVQLLYSASDQSSLEAGIGELVTGARDLAPVLGLSLEPLLGPIDLGRLLMIDWVIVGGESGPHARACDIAWIRSIVAQCKAANVACFVKQLGSTAIDSSLKDVWCNGEHHYTRPAADPDGVLAEAATRRGYSTTPHILSRLLTDKKGGDWNEWPADLRVREFPEVPRA